MKIPRVSIIVPVYNVEAYLGVCLDSLIAQTLTEIEIICVNDCSPDNSRSIIEKYARRDDRIKIVEHEQNQGLGAARNSGVKAASGDYIGFVDSDDYVSRDMFELLYTALEQNGCQMAMCGISRVSEDGRIETTGDDLKKRNCSVTELLADTTLYEAILPACNKLYIRDIIQDIKQLAIVSEDQPFLGELFARIDTVSIVSKPCYYYRNRQGTLSKPREHTPREWDSFFYAHRLFFEHLQTRFTHTQLRVQSLKRSLGILWRIKQFNLLSNANWDEQENAIVQHLKKDDLCLRFSSTLVYLYLRLVLSGMVSLPKKRKLINKGMALIRLCATNPRSQSKDLFFGMKIILSAVKHSMLSLLDDLEVRWYKTAASCMRFFTSKRIWLVGERTDTMQDNGFAFFEYLRNNCPDEKVYYILEASIVATLGNDSLKKSIVNYNNSYHKLLFYSARVYANSHYNSGYPRTRFMSRLYPRPSGCLNVFLQHGITYADVSPFYGKNNSDIDLFVCGAKPEYDFVVEKFGFEKRNVLLTGFPRFDKLHDYVLKKQILLMPTWRRTLSNMSCETFLKTEYYIRLNGMINSPELSLILEKYDYTLVFVPHYEMSRFLSSFNTSNQRINITQAVGEIPKLLKESSVLITDVSSVQFDVAYMKKSILYYCWDYQELTATHLGRGYYSHHKMGFGPVVDNESALIDRLSSVLERGTKMERQYVERVNSFFPLMDNKNSERLYNHLKVLIK